MTDTAARPPTTEAPTPGPSRARRLAGRAATPLRPIWETAFRDPIRDGHIRLEGLSWTERQAARFGLVTLVLLLGSLLFVDVWRRGTLLPLGDGAGLTFLPAGLLSVTLLCLVAAWVMLTWGALTSGWPVKLLVALGFLMTNASLSIAGSIEVGESRALRWGPDLVTGGYYAVAGLVVLSIGLAWLPPRVSSRLLPVLRLLVLVALLTFFLTHLWIHDAYSDAGFPAIVQAQVSGAITEIDGLLLPLVYVAAVLVIDFSLNTALGVTRTAGETSVRVGRWLLVALLAVKLWFLVLDELGEWATYIADRPVAVARTTISIALLAALVRWVTRFAATESLDDAKERLLYGSGLALGAPTLASLLVVGSGVFAISQVKTDGVPAYVDAFPAEGLATWGFPTMSGLAVVVGGWLLRRRRTPMDRELGSGLVVVGAWALPSFLINQTDYEIGFSDDLVDVLVTLGVVAVLAWSWRRLTARTVVVLGAVTVFTWLAMTKGDWIGLVGSLFGLPAILVVVVGIVFSVAGDAGFTAESGRLVPQGGRVMLFVGYLVLSVTILHWVEATHASSNAGFLADSGFYFIGIPWAAWAVGRKLLP